jgi:N-acetylglucosaminyldiphosphoundecaprenol N-acetyl-beta-D-mannosaminyltransferase
MLTNQHPVQQIQLSSAAGILRKQAKVISLTLTLGSYATILNEIIQAAHRRQSRTVCLANVHMTVEGERDKTFAKLVNSADWVVTDGMPLTWVIRLLYKQHQDRIAGIDVLPDLIQRAAQEQLPIFFYGSTPAILEKAIAICQKRYPTVKIVGTLSPPFRTLTPEEEIHTVNQINNSGARLVFVALGCPKQERWMAQMRGQIQAVMVGIGGALPILAGVQTRSPVWMQRAGLEWIFRLAIEPRRLFKRYAITNSLFIYYLLHCLTHLYFSSNERP